MWKLFLSILILSMFLHCKTSDKLYDQGNYEAAISKSLKSISKGKNVNKEKKVLNRSLRAYVKQKDREIKEFLRKKKGLEKDLKFTIKEYEELQGLFGESQLYIDEKSAPIAAEVAEKYESVRLNLYDYYLTVAEENMESFESTGSKINARISYEHFMLANEMEMDIDFPTEDMETMLYYAIERINITFDLFEDEVKREFVYNLRKNERYHQYYIDENTKNIDCTIDIDCMFFDVDDDEDKEQTSHSKQVQDGYTTSKDSTGKEIRTPRYINVNAIVTRIIIKREADWRISFNVRDESGHCTLSDESFSPRVEYKIDRYSYTGDKRALPSNYRGSNSFDRLPVEKVIKEDMAKLILEYFEREYSR